MRMTPYDASIPARFWDHRGEVGEIMVGAVYVLADIILADSIPP